MGSARRMSRLGPGWARGRSIAATARRTARRRRDRTGPARLRTGQAEPRQVQEKSKGALMTKIHAIQTGTVAVTSAWREGVGHGKRRLLNTIRDPQWTEPLPIYAFA